MKLYLGSQFLQFPDVLKKLVGVSAKDANVQVVVNAFDNYPEGSRAMHAQSLLTSIEAAGYSCSLLDLRDYFDRQDDLKKILFKADLLWVSGGNVFYLRYVLKQSGLDNMLPDLLENGLTYAGDSAGAAVLGPNMHGLDLLDDPAEAPELMFEGLAITPFIVLPHWGNERYKNEIGAANKELMKWNKEIVKISDDQACVVDGNNRIIHG